MGTRQGSLRLSRPDPISDPFPFKIFGGGLLIPGTLPLSICRLSICRFLFPVKSSFIGTVIPSFLVSYVLMSVKVFRRTMLPIKIVDESVSF